MDTDREFAIVSPMYELAAAVSEDNLALDGLNMAIVSQEAIADHITAVYVCFDEAGIPITFANPKGTPKTAIEDMGNHFQYVLTFTPRSGMYGLWLKTA